VFLPALAASESEQCQLWKDTYPSLMVLNSYPKYDHGLRNPFQKSCCIPPGISMYTLLDQHLLVVVVDSHSGTASKNLFLLMVDSIKCV